MEKITGFPREPLENNSPLLTPGFHKVDPANETKRIYVERIEIFPSSSVPEEVSALIQSKVFLYEYPRTRCDFVHLHFEMDLPQRDLYTITRHINDTFGKHEFLGGYFIQATTYVLRDRSFIGMSFGIGNRPTSSQTHWRDSLRSY